MSTPQNNCAIPWFLIAKQAIRGTSLETLSTRYHVSVAEIQARLDVAICRDPTGNVRLRNNAEISQASSRARNDLVSILLESIEELQASVEPRLDQTEKLQTLSAVAAKLFSWTTSHSLRTVNVTNPPPYTPESNNAVNLTLAATTPEQLRAIADQQEAKQHQND